MRLPARFALALALWLCGCYDMNDPADPAVLQAVAQEDMPRLRQLLDAGTPPDAPGVRVGFTPLQIAARQGSLETIRLLVAAGADPNLATGRNGWTPLLHAIHKHQVEAVDELLRQGAAVDAPGTSGLTPLVMAAGYGQTDMVDMLLEHGADVWKPKSGGPLLAAVTGNFDIDAMTIGCCQSETVRALLAHEPSLRQQAGNLGPLTKLYLHLRCHDVVTLLSAPEGEVKNPDK